MKLRLRENSVRLRLLQSEVKKLAESGFVAEEITFSPSRKLVYRVEISNATEDIAVCFEKDTIDFNISPETARNWLDTNLIGLEKEQQIEDAPPLKILIEKDFVCPDRPFDKDNADAFPHPAQNC